MKRGLSLGSTKIMVLLVVIPLVSPPGLNSQEEQPRIQLEDFVEDAQWTYSATTDPLTDIETGWALVLWSGNFLDFLCDADPSSAYMHLISKQLKDVRYGAEPFKFYYRVDRLQAVGPFESESYMDPLYGEPLVDFIQDITSVKEQLLLRVNWLYRDYDFYVPIEGLVGAVSQLPCLQIGTAIDN